MGLASALTTALTGLTAAETQIDVVGNNLANSQTVGFKASKTVFATQFLQTLSLGSSPTTNNGGTNPRQTGLGVQIAEITPDFTQGTIEISSNPSDLAIQGDGFFIVEGPGNERLYTRNGVFKTNSENQLVTVGGDRLLGYGVDELFNLSTQAIVPLEVPLGQKVVATATENVFFEGTLTPKGDVADTAEVLESAVLGDAAVPRPDATVTATIATPPQTLGVGFTHNDGGGTLEEGQTYQYRFVFLDSTGNESKATEAIPQTVPVGSGGDDNTITINPLPTPPPSSPWTDVRIYRTDSGGTQFKAIADVPVATTTYTDTGAVGGTVLDDANLIGNYSYLVTFLRDGSPESRPSPLVGPVSVVDGRIRIDNLPPIPVPGPDDDFPPYNQYRLYRNTVSDSSTYFELATLNPGESFVDNVQDDVLELADLVDLDGPKAGPNTLLSNVLVRDDLNYESPFEIGEITFEGRKGGRSLGGQDFSVDATTTLQNIVDFFGDAMGIQVAADDSSIPVPSSLNTLVASGAPLTPGVSIEANGRIRVVSNNGVDNAVDINLSAFQLIAADDNEVTTPSLGFASVQDAVGQSTTTDFLVFDTLGSPINVRVTAVLEEKTGSQTVYRWFADSTDNQPLSGNDIAVGTGRIIFGGEGNFVSSANNTASIHRRDSPAASPLEITLQYDLMSGLATENPSLAASRQDGSPPGTLTSFRVGEDGVIAGVFDNGVARTLGQVQMARFTNPSGLEQRGENLYRSGANSGLAVRADPGKNGAGSLIAGAVELSNTDIGQNLIDLVLATTQYRGNTRVITTAQQLIDELLNLRR